MIITCWWDQTRFHKTKPLLSYQVRRELSNGTSFIHLRDVEKKVEKLPREWPRGYKKIFKMVIFWTTNSPWTFDDHQIFYAGSHITFTRLGKEIKPLHSDLTDIWALQYRKNYHFYPMTHKNVTLWGLWVEICSELKADSCSLMSGTIRTIDLRSFKQFRGP